MNNIGNFLRRLFIKRNELKDVFTPNRAARLAYIKREIIENDLERDLSLPGRQIVVYGHSGSGKTTLLRNKLRELKQNFIITHCESHTTFDELLLQAFDQLNRFYISEQTTNASYSIGQELRMDFKSIGSKISEQKQVSLSDKKTRIVPPQLTPQKLAHFLGEIDCVWIIEDFHKVIEEEKKRIADIIKIFIDIANDFEKVKIICIGAVGTARELVELDDNLRHRVSELNVPLLTDDEIKSIIIRGFELLNIHISNRLRDQIVYYSNNIASITHRICHSMCFNAKIKVEKLFISEIQDDFFKRAMEEYVRGTSDTFLKTYDKVCNSEYGWYILKSFDFTEKESLLLKEILNKIPMAKRPTKEGLLEYLHLLTSSEYDEVIRFDKSSEKYSISNPFFKGFLKMKLELNKTEQEEINNKRYNKKNNRYALKGKSNITFNEEFYDLYKEIIDKINKN